jgi:predicted PurR-regulated permease PerM
MLTEERPPDTADVQRAVMAVAAELRTEPILEVPLGQRAAPRINAVQVVILILASIAFLYFARPVVLPVVIALMAATTLKPLMRGLAYLRVPTVPSAILVFVLLLTVAAVAFVEVGRPAIAWMDDAPQHLTDLRDRAGRLFPNAHRMTDAVNAVNQLAASPAKKDPRQKVETVEVHDQRGASFLLNWTGTALAGIGEVLVLIYLMLSSGDMFMQKLVRVMPSLREKKRAVEVTREIQSNIAVYLFSVTGINIVLGSAAAVGFYLMGLPKAAMWGMVVALLNYVPYFGPVLGVMLVGAAGFLSFDTVGMAVMPGIWYLLLHLVESNFLTPILLGRRFTLNPVAIFISLMFWFWLWGIPGALLSVPILVSIKSVCDRFPKAELVSEFIGRPLGETGGKAAEAEVPAAA